MDFDHSSDQIKAEFARRLQAAMIQKGWNQSELARRANEHLPKSARDQSRGKAIGRDSVSHYMRGRMMPLPAYLEALAKALSVEPVDLLPARTPSVSPVPFEMRGMEGGRVFVRINRTVTAETAEKIMRLMMEEDRNS